MSDLEIRDWIEIIDREVETQTRSLFVFVSKLGSALLILALLIWFTYTNFIKSQNPDFILMLLFFIQNSTLYLILVASIFEAHNYKITTRRIKLKLPIEKENIESLPTKRKSRIMDITILSIIILNICEYLSFEDYLYYFALTSLMIFIIGIIFWIYLLFSIIYSSNIKIYRKLKCDILSGKITDMKMICDKYLSIDDKPPEVVIVNEKGEYEEF